MFAAELQDVGQTSAALADVAMKSLRTIRNCSFTWKVQCPKEWVELDATLSESVRHCQECERDVYYCATDDETLDHARLGHCIARAQPDDRHFDAVVAFGPFYHLVSEEERGSAAREIWRVLSPDGLTFVSFIPRLSGLAGLIERAANNPQQVSVGTLARAASSGVFRNQSDEGFQEGYYPTAAEIRGLFEATGFTVLDLISLRSVANLLEGSLARVAEPLRSEVDDVLERAARDPAVVATGGHAVLIARKVS
jgi:hypothetical protein